MSEGGVLPPIVLELRAKSSELKAELAATKKELSELDHHTSSTSSSMGRAFTKTAGYGKTLTVGIAGAAVAVGGFAIECATSAEVVDAKLATAVKNAGGNMEELDPKISKVDGTLRKFGFTNDQTNTALATLTVATKSPEKALESMGVAADLARAKNIDLNTASLMVAKAMEGQTRPLKALGIDLPVYAGNAQAVKLAQLALANAQQKVTDILHKTPGAVNPASKAHASYEKALRAVQAAHTKLAAVQSSGKQIMAALETRVHGMAAAYGDTLKGKIEAGKASVEAMGETLGKKLIPIVVKALGAAQDFVGWLGNHTPVLYTVAGVIGGAVVLAIGAYISSLIYAGTMSVVNFAKMILLGEEFAATQEAGFAKAIAGMIRWIAQHIAMAAAAVVQYGLIAAAATAAFIAENAATLGIIAVIALLVAAIVFLATHWKQVWQAICDAASWAYHNVILPVGRWIMDNVLKPIGSAISTLWGIWSRIWSAIGGAVKAGAAVIAGVFGGIIGGIGKIIGAIQNVIGWFTRMFDSANNAADASRRAAQLDAGRAAAGAAALNGGRGLGSNVKGSVGNFVFGPATSGRPGGPSKLGGGWLFEAPKGRPIAMTGHGGEYMLSVDMLEGRQKIDQKVVAAVAGGAPQAMTANALNGGSGGRTSGGNTVIVNAQTNASPHRIGAEVGWVLRGMA